MTRTRRFFGGLGPGYAYQVAVMLVGLWLTRFLLARLGQHDYGLWLVATQILGYLLLMDLGVVALLPRETAYATGRAAGGGRSELPEVIGRTTRVVLWQTPLVAVAALVVWLLTPAEWAALRQPLGLVLVAFVATYPLRVLPEALKGLQDLAFTGWAQLGTWALGTVATVLLVLAGYGLTSLAIGWIVGQVASSLALWLRLRTHFREALPKGIPSLTWEQVRQQLSRGWWVSIGQVSQVLLAGSDVLIIGKLLGPAATVPYVCTAKLIAVLGNQPLIVLQAAAPGLSELKMAESRERLSQVTSALMQAVLLMSGAVACLVAAVNHRFVVWWVGPSRYGGWLLVAALLAVMIARHVASTIVYALFAFGYERRLAVVGIVDGVVTVTAALLLVPRLGALGAALASFGSVCLVALPLTASSLVRETGQGVRRFAMTLWPLAWRFALALLLAIGLALLQAPATVPVAMGLGAVAVVAYGLLMRSLMRREPLSLYVPKRLAWLIG